VQRLVLRNEIDMECLKTLRNEINIVCLKTYKGVKKITMKLQIPRHGLRHQRAGGGAYDEAGVCDGAP
jgi:hypothetical protein